MIYDIFYVSRNKIDETDWLFFNNRFPSSQKIENVKTFLDISKKSFTKLFWVVWNDLTILEDFNFSYIVPKWDEQYIHVFKNAEYFDGVTLFPKNSNISSKEFQHRFYINKKEIDITASVPKPFEKFYINTYEEYLETVNNTNSDMFWVIWNDIEIDYDFDYYIPYYDYFHRNITHIFKNSEHFDGLCLFSKNTTISKKEFDHRFFTNKKEVDLVVSKPKIYDKFIIDSYDDYLTAKSNSSTDMFWFIPKEVLVDDNFKFDLYFSHHNVIDRNMNHVFKNMFRGEETYTGISLVSKNKELSQKEITHRFLVEKKHHNIVASKLCPYDIVFISYNEPTADDNFRNLKSRFPRAKRVHGVKGIHQAHIAASKLAETCMFWVVDGDAEIVEDFNFDHEVSTYEKDIVHVWRSKNPVNDLVYGYGGVKLLPTTMTLNMDMSKPDMTTSISSKFKAVKAISNITAFNTDPFSTWKSAFRECCKLSSKIIDRQKDEETLHRLNIWCTVGTDRLFGNVAIAGAKAGSEYGSANKDNLEALKKINDFDWLKRKFDE